MIADAIGAGKTLISIAIILNGIQCARANRSYPRKTSATLVVVPPGLIDQWRSEIFKFQKVVLSGLVACKKMRGNHGLSTKLVINDE